MSELFEKLGDFKELLLDDIKNIALNYSKFEDFSNYIKKEIDLKEHLFDLYQEHAYNLPYEIDPQEGVKFISRPVFDEITTSDIQISEDDCLDRVISKFVVCAFEIEINEFLDQIKNNKFDGIFDETQIEKTQDTIDGFFK